MNLGFGTQPQLDGDQGLEVPLPSTEAPVEEMADDIRQIRERYVQAPTFDTVTERLPISETRLYQYQETTLNGFIVDVRAGTLFLWFGDYRGGAASSDPHLQYTPVGVPTFIPLPVSKNYRFTVFASGAECRYTFIPLAL